MQFFGGSEISPSPPLPTALGNNGHMMYVFNGNGICLLYREWNRPQQDLHELMFVQWKPGMAAPEYLRQWFNGIKP